MLGEKCGLISQWVSNCSTISSITLLLCNFNFTQRVSRIASLLRIRKWEQVSLKINAIWQPVMFFPSNLKGHFHHLDQSSSLPSHSEQQMSNPIDVIRKSLNFHVFSFSFCKFKVKYKLTGNNPL